MCSQYVFCLSAQICFFVSELRFLRINLEYFNEAIASKTPLFDVVLLIIPCDNKFTV